MPEPVKAAARIEGGEISALLVCSFELKSVIGLACVLQIDSRVAGCVGAVRKAIC